MQKMWKRTQKFIRIIVANEGEAMEYVRSKLLFHKITPKQDDHLEQLKNILGL